MTAADVIAVAIVDDEPEIRAAVRQLLEFDQLKAVEFGDGEAALAHLDADFAGIVIADLRMPGMDGSALFARLRALDPELPVIMMSGHGDIATAVDLVRRGAYDFLAKPFDGSTLVTSIRRALEKRTLVLENRRLRVQPAAALRGTLLGESPEMETLRQIILQLAAAEIDVTITGESGTGKGLIAEILHRRSARARKPLVTVDCGALPAGHAESMLFGHVSGAFPGAQFPRSGQLRAADGGTLFLDNIDALPRLLQTRVQQALEQRLVLPMGADQGQKSQFATISATSHDLETMVTSGCFDRSLYHRLGGFRLAIPPLRHRRGDAVVLFRAFLMEAAAATNRPPPDLSPSVWRHLRDYDWPGNVRELRNFAANVALGLVDGAARLRQPAGTANDVGLKTATAAFEAEMIRATLDRLGGDITATLAALQLPRKTLYDKLARHGIEPADYRAKVPRRA